jgi:hypothetical protein
MKVGLITIAIVSLALSAARGIQMLDFRESGEGHFAVLLNNSPWPHATVDISGETYTITLDEGYSFNPNVFFPVEIDEPDIHITPEGILQTNFINIDFEERTMFWFSEGETNASPSHNNPTIVTNGVLGPNGEMFDVRLIDVPESPSTISIFGIGLAGLAWFAMCRRRAM